MAVRFAAACFLLVLLVGFFGDAGAQCFPTSCRCQIQRNCPNIAADPQVHFDLMDSEFVRAIRGRRAERNAAVFCRNRCLNLLKSYLCTPYDFSTIDRPDGVILDTSQLIGNHRICQGVPESDTNCVFTLMHGSNCGLNSINIGTTGCLAIDINSGLTPPAPLILNFADEANTGTSTSYLGGFDFSSLNTMTLTSTTGN